MKKIIIISCALIAFIFIGCKESATAKVKTANLETAKQRDDKISLGSPVIEFDQEVYDFGTITEGDIVEGVFKVTNKGKVDLLLTEVKPSCGCTTPDWTKDAIKPGETGEIKFEFNSNGRVGNQNKSITVKSNAEQTTKVIRIKGVVKAKT
jgi:hypothetical protein